MTSYYKDSRIILTTKHGKSAAIAPSFERILHAAVVEHNADTDILGTFSGEVQRRGSALDCVKYKCQWGMQQTQAEFGLASEGSFGLHPFIPFLPCDHEILYFIDCRRNFHLYLSDFSEKTNYRMEALDSWEEVQKFADTAQFPSHALILRPNDKEVKTPIFKGVNTKTALEQAFYELKKCSDGKVFIETDMRAHFNPSRMLVIARLAEKLAKRIATHCPQCRAPGWGKVRVERGLECGWCKSETELVKSEIFGCIKCNYEESVWRTDGLKQAEPRDCTQCNP